MNQSTQLNLDILLPTLDPTDECIHLLTDRLVQIKGIEKAHIVEKSGAAQLCLHYDSNLISLKTLKQLAREAGARITDRYQHEEIPFGGLKVADAASGVEKTLQSLPGMLHARINYAAGLIFVAYDTQVLSSETVRATLQRAGVKIVSPKTQPATSGEPHDGHDHGSAPSFLPHAIQERWALILVGLAGAFFLIGWSGEQFFDLNQTVALVFFGLSYLAGGYDVTTHALPGLLKGKFDTDVLMLAAAAGAALLGEWAEGAFLLFLFGLGHAGEHYALDRARNAVNALGELLPRTAHVKRGDQIVEADVNTLQVDDVVVVRPGDRFPVDGKIATGQSTVDQSPITGESVPINKTIGDDVFAGTINLDNAVEVRVTKVAQDNTLSRVMKLVAEAQSQQSPTQQFTERFTAWFVPAVLVGTCLIILIPIVAGWSSFEASFYRGMLLLVAASPCALAIGTPAAVLAGIAQAARQGVLIKGGVHLENLGGLKTIAFDKTGTITSGEFSVTDVISLNNTPPDELLRVAGSVEQQSNHPLAQAIVREAKARNLNLPTADSLENVAGKGVRSGVEGEPVYIGTLKLFREIANIAVSPELEQVVQKLEAGGRTTATVSHKGMVLGVLGLADTPRPAATGVMARLKALGIVNLVMLTGDNQQVAQHIAAQVGLTEVQAELLPEDKLKTIQQLQQQHGSIAMIGDGVNDAPALASATVGIAMGGAGTAVALETADVALMGDDLSRLPFAVGLSRASLAITRQNLVISLGVIGLLMITSVLALVPLSGAVFFHEGSTIVVVVNALRLLTYRGGD